MVCAGRFARIALSTPGWSRGSLDAIRPPPDGPPRDQPPPTAKSDSGPLAGGAEDRANVFRNIPFAAPPVGELRWAPPQPVKPWTAPRPAAEPGPSCPQPMNANDTPNSGGANGPTSED